MFYVRTDSSDQIYFFALFFFCFQIRQTHRRIGFLSKLSLTCVHVSLQVEFEWLRQYWFQGQRYARFCSWWTRPMEQLEKDWRLMETMVRPLRHNTDLTVCFLSLRSLLTSVSLTSLILRQSSCISISIFKPFLQQETSQTHYPPSYAFL